MFPHTQRLRALVERVTSDGVLILSNPAERFRSRDTTFRYRALSDILYLTGFREPEAILVVAPGHDLGDTLLFVRPRDPEKEAWSGRRAGPEGAIAATGVDAALPLADFSTHLPALLSDRSTVYFPAGESHPLEASLHAACATLDRRRPSAAPTSIARPKDLLHAMRMLKDDHELSLMRRAAEISAEAHVLAMRACRPGMREYELRALLEYHFLRSGAQAPAYETIVGAHDNATILHYVDTTDVLAPGDLVLIDAACECSGYAADITRTFPVCGSFSQAQRDVYDIVLAAQEDAIAHVGPAVPLRDLQTRAHRALTQGLVDLGVLQGDIDALLEDKAHAPYTLHSLGHWLGLDVHDVGAYYESPDVSKPLRPRMVLTIEPGLYFPLRDPKVPEALRGIGVRIEDDILVTDQGSENLTRTCPKAPDALEALIGTLDAIDVALPTETGI
ncbi:MAG: aminopeptidase P N-terminal domain-containing protein [Myxococcota bacterium]